MADTNTLAEIAFVDKIRAAIEAGLSESKPGTKPHLEYIDRAFTWLEFTDEDGPNDDDGAIIVPFYEAE